MSNHTPEFIALALEHSRNFAAANPRLSKTTVEHIEGLCNIVESLAPAVQQHEGDRVEQAVCEWCEGDGYLAGESPAKRCRYCGGKGRAPFAATLRQQAGRVDEAQATLDAVCDALGIGSAARTRGVIVTNVRNARRRSECLSAIEREFTVEVPDEDGDEGDTTEECPLRWGDSPEQYIVRFREAIAALAQNTQGEAEGVAEIFDALPHCSERTTFTFSRDKLQALLRHAERARVPEDAIEAAATECARRAYGYWKGDSTGGQSAMDYFDKGLPARQWHIDFYAEILRKHWLAAAPSQRAEVK